jgi:hypothetical protein
MGDVTKPRGRSRVEPSPGTGAGSAKAAVARAATPWGSATVVEEARVSQQVGERRFASIVQLFEDDRRRPLVRFTYTTDGVSRRGPVTLRPKDIERLRAALRPGSALAAALGWPPPAGATTQTADDRGGEA